MFNEVRSMEALKKTAESRPPGYLEDVLSHCEWYNEKEYKISEKVFMELRKKYSSSTKKMLTRKQQVLKIKKCNVKCCSNPLDEL